jgi:DNA-binding NtrC family response regulator
MRQPPAQRPRDKHILVVDDEGGVGEVVRQMLEERGYRVTVAAGGVAMREALLAEAFDAVVLDAMMPGERSATLALHAKELRLPVVMISGNHEMMAFATGHDLQLLPKPFTMDRLHGALEQAFASGEFGQRAT